MIPQKQRTPLQNAQNGVQINEKKWIFFKYPDWIRSKNSCSNQEHKKGNNTYRGMCIISKPDSREMTPTKLPLSNITTTSKQISYSYSMITTFPIGIEPLVFFLRSWWGWARHFSLSLFVYFFIITGVMVENKDKKKWKRKWKFVGKTVWWKNKIDGRPHRWLPFLLFERNGVCAFSPLCPCFLLTWAVWLG